MPFDRSQPIPAVHDIGDWAKKYRFDEMIVGESIFADGMNDGLRLRRAAAAYRARHPGWEYRSKRESPIPGGLDGIRIWRTA